MEERTCIAIDLKSFYASVECIERGLDPMDTHLVVADKRRTEKTICLAVTPALKARGRARTAAAVRGRPAPARRAGTGVCRFVPQRRAVFALRGADRLRRSHPEGQPQNRPQNRPDRRGGARHQRYAPRPARRRQRTALDIRRLF